jgi:hypothetical protein
MILSRNKNRAFWICAAMTILNAMVSAGFAVATVVQDPGNSPALYALSRSLSLFAVGIGAAVFKSKPAVVALAVAMVLVQLADTGIGIVVHDASKTFGPLFLALATLAALVQMLRDSRNNSLGKPERLRDGI